MLRRFQTLWLRLWTLLYPVQKQNNKEHKLSIRIPVERETTELSKDLSEFSEIDLNELRSETSTKPHQISIEVRR